MFATPDQVNCGFLQLPSSEEISALLTGRKLTCIATFLDETFEELQYDIATTVAEAVEQLAGIIKLSEYSTFTLYEARKVGACSCLASVACICYSPAHQTVIQSIVWALKYLYSPVQRSFDQ